MSTREEIELLMREAESAKRSLTAEEVVDRARNRRRYPSLHAYLWEVDEKTLLEEARVARAHRLIIRVYTTTSEGVRTRLYVHTSSVAGYQPIERVAGSPNLAADKLTQLRADIGRARARLRAFAAMLPAEIAADIDAALAIAEEKAGASREARVA